MYPENFTTMEQLADTQQLALSGTAAHTTAAPAGVIAARVVALSDAWVREGAGAVAAANTSMRLPAGTIEYLRVRPGDRISAIQAASGGTVDVTWMT